MSIARIARRHAFARLLLGLTAIVVLALLPATADAASFGQRTLRPGMAGKDVKTLQRFLTMAGYRTPVSGEYGRVTFRRVRSFEFSYGRKPDGVVGRPEARLLYRAAKNGPSGGVSAGGPPPDIEPAPVPGEKAKLLSDGTVLAPASAPASVKGVIAAANRIASTPYRYGGGHASFNDTAYDCSGSVSYALHGGGLLSSPRPSGGFYTYGAAGRGKWITLYANGGHMYAVIAGLRFDTSGANGGSRWQREMRSGSGYQVRHPAGL